jgi:hypothetical protein
MIEENVAKRAAAADAAADAQLVAALQGTGKTDVITKPGEPKKIDTGTLAAIGLVLTTLLGALGAIFGNILKLDWWQIPLAFLAILLAISAPSMLIAYLKLRNRNLGPILDANGWAVNAKAKMNVPFGGSLTCVATLPSGAQRDLVDPFAEKKSPWPKIITAVLVLVIAYVILERFGYINDWSDGHIGRRRIALSSLTLTPNSLISGNTSQGTVTLTSVAPSGGAVVIVSSSNPSVASTPGSVTVTSGSSSAMFTITTGAVNLTTNVTISAAFKGVTRTAILSAIPAISGEAPVKK